MKSINNQGFTLIELILTIALLSIISIISFVSITTIINKNKDNECNSIVNNIKIAAKEYASDNRYNSIFQKNTTLYKLIQTNYLTEQIINPCTKEPLTDEKLQKIIIVITLYDDNTVKDIVINDRNQTPIFNECHCK